MITTTGLNVFGKSVLSSVDHGAAITDGQTKTVDIYKSEVSGNAVTIYLLFDGSYSGHMTKFQLQDVSNNSLVEQPDDIQKITEKLLLVSFTITLNERVVSN